MFCLLTMTSVIFIFIFGNHRHNSSMVRRDTCFDLENDRNLQNKLQFVEWLICLFNASMPICHMLDELPTENDESSFQSNDLEKEDFRDGKQNEEQQWTSA